MHDGHPQLTSERKLDVQLGRCVNCSRYSESPKCRTSGCCIVNRVIVLRLDVATLHKGGCEHAEESSRVANHALRDLHRFSTNWRVDPMVFEERILRPMSGNFVFSLMRHTVDKVFAQ